MPGIARSIRAWLHIACAAILLLGAPAGATAGGTILVYGDSLSSAYGIGQREGWVALLQDRLRSNRLDYNVVNASISGETSSGGASRIAAVLAQHRPDFTVVALGANDGLRGLPVAQLKANLAAIIRSTQKAGSRVALVGMRMPPNYGATYTKAFENVYRDLGRQFKLPMVPFLLEGMADQPALFLSDQLHPTAAAQPILLDNVWKGLAPIFR
jgi:acyl-CoA thioesterase-1